ncbi:unnamed protein product [Rhizopus stolonifer]
MALSLTIIPDTDTIDTFHNNTTLPNQVYVIKGTVEINVSRPIQVKQLYVQFRGNVESLVGVSDLQFEEKHAVFGDQIPIDQWETLDDDELSLVSRLSRRAFGQSLAIYSLIDESLCLLDEPRLFPKGKTSWPFHLTLHQIHLLPPSILTPHHKIAYHLLARIKLNSLTERVRVTYWHVCMQITNDHDATIRMQPLKHKRQILGASQKISLSRHSYPNMQTVNELHRVRYRGSRSQRISYEISMAKSVCLQQNTVDFNCQFHSFVEDTKIKTIEYYLEQIETYPTKPGTQITMETEDNTVNLNLRLPFDLPHISPPIHTHTLKISHRLKVLVKFRDEIREKNMSLSFPLTVVTVPSRLTNNRSVSVTHAQIEIDPWNHEQTHDLPSYFQAIREGMPPSPFIEDN